MCDVCIINLQEAMDEMALMDPPERLYIHIESPIEPCDGKLLGPEEVEKALHESYNEQCWCQPIIIEPSDTRTALEVYNGRFELERVT